MAGDISPQGRRGERSGEGGKGWGENGCLGQPSRPPCGSESIATHFVDETRGHYFGQRHSSKVESLPDSSPCPTLSFLLAVEAGPKLHPFLCPDRLCVWCSQGELLAPLRSILLG